MRAKWWSMAPLTTNYLGHSPPPHSKFCHQPFTVQSDYTMSSHFWSFWWAEWNIIKEPQNISSSPLVVLFFVPKRVFHPGPSKKQQLPCPVSSTFFAKCFNVLSVYCVCCLLASSRLVLSSSTSNLDKDGTNKSKQTKQTTLTLGYVSHIPFLDFGLEAIFIVFGHAAMTQMLLQLLHHRFRALLKPQVWIPNARTQWQGLLSGMNHSKHLKMWVNELGRAQTRQRQGNFNCKDSKKEPSEKIPLDWSKSLDIMIHIRICILIYTLSII